MNVISGDEDICIMDCMLWFLVWLHAWFMVVSINENYKSTKSAKGIKYREYLLCLLSFIHCEIYI